ncbi:MAG: isoleucine--tRNA ligase, partial [Acidimicrobiia bacterium]|nr:isoleucine--tRNA ligase [Acidimicrobiia bacterium]
LIADELNVRTVKVHADEGGLVDLTAKADFKVLGPRYGARTKEVAAAIADLDHDAIVSLLDGRDVDTGDFSIQASDVIVTRTPRPGTVVATEDSLSVALDCAISDDLATEGLARETVNRIQTLRKDAGLEVTDRIVVSIATGSDRLRTAVDVHRELIQGEVLADTIEVKPSADGNTVEIDGEPATVTITRS